MSVINQLLVDLEKRRASSNERGLIPNYVQALPPAPPRLNPIWAAGAGVLVLGIIAAWVVMFGSFNGQAVVRSGGETAVLPAQPIQGSRVPRAGGPPMKAPPATGEEAVEATIASAFQPVGRLSFELSTLPPETDNRVRRTEAISSSRVVTRAENAAPTAVVLPRAQSPASQGAIRKMQSEVAAVEPEIDKRVRQPTAQQLAEGEYRKATVALHAGKVEAARTGFEAALARYPQHLAARQALFGLLVEQKQLPDAERVLQEGLDLAPGQIGFAMAMARLQVDRGDVPAAIGTLQKSAGYAAGHAEYLAFLAALLHREKRYAEAVDQFVAALRLKPNTGVWLLGLAISLEALSRNAEAREAYGLARATGTLNPGLQAFADERLQVLR